MRLLSSEIAPHFLLSENVDIFHSSNVCAPITWRQAVVTRIKAMGLPPGLDVAQVAQALGEGRGSQADLVVAVMETKGTGRIDFYEVRSRSIPLFISINVEYLYLCTRYSLDI